MDWIVHLLFESPLQLLAALVMLEAVLATIWWFRPGRNTFGAIVGGLLLGAVLLVVQRLVVTDREKIQELLGVLALAVDCKDLRTIEPAIDDTYAADGMNRAQLLERIKDVFAHSEIDDVRLVDVKVTVEDDRSAVRLRVHCRVRAPDWPYDYSLSAWDVQLVRRGEAWRVAAAHHRSDTGLSAKDLIDVVTH
jgi:hypothetical protein